MKQHHSSGEHRHKGRQTSSTRSQRDSDSANAHPSQRDHASAPAAATQRPAASQATATRPPAGAQPAAGSPPAANLDARIHDRSPEVLRTVASDPRLTEELALGLLTRRDLTERVLEDLSKNGVVMKSRKVLNALVRHPRTPRHVSIPIARRLYTFELMQIALTPGVMADLKMVADDGLISRLESVSAGERLTLSRRASTRVAAALLFDPEVRIVEAALENPHLTEAVIVKAIMDDRAAPQHFISAVCRHPKWSLRREIRIALLRNPNTPFAQVLGIAQSLPTQVLRDVLQTSRLAENIRAYLLQQIELRKH